METDSSQGTRDRHGNRKGHVAHYSVLWRTDPRTCFATLDGV